MCGGYDSLSILEKVKQSTLKVKNGEATFERDSVIFNHTEYNYPLLTCLFYVSSCFHNRLRVIDFGGALGSTFYQCRNLLAPLDDIKWSIVEQSQFVECGNQFIKEDSLDFYYSLEDCLNQNDKEVLLISSTLQYLDQPYKYLEEILSYNLPFLMIDRTPFFDLPDRITIQKVSPYIYEASYPAWFFNKKKFLSFVNRKYEMTLEWDSFEKWDLGDVTVNNKGMLLRRKDL